MEYTEQRNCGFYVAGTRVSLDSIIAGFRDGDSPETIRQNFSSLTLEQVYGAVAFYLRHRAEVDQNISEADMEFDRDVPSVRERNPEAYDRLQRARERHAHGRQ